MRKTIAILFVMAVLMTAITTSASAMVTGIDGTNYDTYIKPVKAVYGYNKGECNTEYLPYEEYFYSASIDCWNVDSVYDKSMIPKIRKSAEYIACKYIEKHYPDWRCIITIKKQSKSATICKAVRGKHIYYATVKNRQVKKFKKIK